MSIVIPGVRTHNWEKLYNSIANSCKNYTFEVIFGSPKKLPDVFENKSNVKFVRDFGSVSRVLQMSALLAEGEYVTWIFDDGVVREDELDNCIQFIENQVDKCIVGMKYTEGVDFQPDMRAFVDEYWTAWHHLDLQLPGIERHWKLPIHMLMKTKHFYQLGGLNCKMEHANMNLHDLGFRAQRDGFEVHISKNFVIDYNIRHGRTVENSNVIAAYYQNDKPMFQEMYLKPQTNVPASINYDNWKEMPCVWERGKLGTFDME